MPARGPPARRGPLLLRPSGRASASGPGLVSSCARVLFVAPSLFRAAATFFVAAPWFSTSGNQEGSLSSSLRLIRSLSTFAVETLLALRGAELPTCGPCCNSAIIARPLGLHEALLSVSWPLAHRNSQLLSALATCCLPLANLSCSLLADFCSSSPTSSVALRACPLAALLSLRSIC